MLLIALLVFGFAEEKTVTFTVRNSFRVTLMAENADAPKSIAGSYRILALTDHVDYGKVKNLVIVCLDDVGYISPVGCTVEVRGEPMRLFTDLGEIFPIVVRKKDQLKVLGLGPVEIPELSQSDKKFTGVWEAREKQLRMENMKRPPTKGKTGIVFPGKP